MTKSISNLVGLEKTVKKLSRLENMITKSE